MYRILYKDSAGNLEILNAVTARDMERSAFEIASACYSIICIYDYTHKRKLFTCSTYDLYGDAINELVYENKVTA